MNYNCDCKAKNKEYFFECCLMIKPKIDKGKINIYDLLEQKMIDKVYHPDCKSNKEVKVEVEAKRIIDNCPKYLIIIIDKDKINYCKFQIHEKINFDKNMIIKKGKKLELNSFIYNKSVYIQHTNQQNQKEWIRYLGKFTETTFSLESALKTYNNHEIPEINGFPDILVYKLKE